MLERVFAGLLAASAPIAVWAHHGWGSYDPDHLVSLSGKIVEASYEYPHGTVRLMAGDKTWTVVLAPPSRMDNRGLTRAMLKAGETAIVEGYAHKSVTDELRAERITVGGKTTELR